MNNYEYITASLPVVSKDWKNANGLQPDHLTDMIREQCSEKDNRLIDLLMSVNDEKALVKETYETAFKSKSRFIREYFKFDLLIRNTKVRYLNEILGRNPEQDIFMQENMEDPDIDKVASGLRNNDILGRERVIDELMWARISEITVFNLFDIDSILGYIAKLNIVNRWLRLDEASGREMFRKLISEIRGTFEGVENKY